MPNGKLSVVKVEHKKDREFPIIKKIPQKKGKNSIHVEL